MQLNYNYYGKVSTYYLNEFFFSIFFVHHLKPQNPNEQDTTKVSWLGRIFKSVTTH